MLLDAISTVLVEPGCVAEITSKGDVRITVHAEEATVLSTQVDAMQLSIFQHRFMWTP
ncbi:hypothetical protein T484DRAFT_1835555 [Baffinella frigidus]|nr:hypothetical protein T484DRAFT_1835555 [Cryptophyta sp. CCMP2293]